MEETKLPGKSDLREVPKNRTIESVVTKVEVKTWRELIEDPKVLEKFSDPDAKQIIVTYESEGFSRDEKFNFMEKPTTTSRLGRYIVRYDTPKVGQTISVDWDSESKPTILIAK